MKIGGYGLRDHLRLLAPLFALIAAVWALRLVLHAAGAPFGLVRICSVTVAGAVSILLAALLIHTRRFGSYPNAVLASFLLVCWEQLLIVAAIAFSAFSHVQNVFAAPEYSQRFEHGGALTPAQHIAGHLTFGLGIGTLFGAAMSCLLLWMLRRLVPMGSSE
jgi:hypothetical protein